VPTSSPAADRAALEALAGEACRAAGALLLDRLHGDRTDVGTKSTGTDMVTEVDRAAEERVVEVLLSARPDDGVVGEEGTDRAGTSGVDWVVDPLDGTTNYLYRHPGFGVSIAASVDGEVVAGAVLDAVGDQLFSAALGGGARLDGRPLLRPPRRAGAPLGEALVATGFSYDPDRRAAQAAVLTHVLPRVRDIRRMGAAAVDLCSVALGRVDAFYERGLAPWDLAAGGLIAAEAGAVVTDLGGGAPSGDFVLAAADAELAESLRRLLADAGAGSA
jgi:myo-inositol-1(or 4)-monophosphatase